MISMLRWCERKGVRPGRGGKGIVFDGWAILSGTLIGTLFLFTSALGCNSPLAAQAGSATGGKAPRVEGEVPRPGVEERQRKLVEDAERLVQLAQQLRTSVGKTNKDVLSVSVVREAEQVEKLAHQMRESSR